MSKHLIITAAVALTAGASGAVIADAGEQSSPAREVAAIDLRKDDPAGTGLVAVEDDGDDDPGGGDGPSGREDRSAADPRSGGPDRSIGGDDHSKDGGSDNSGVDSVVDAAPAAAPAPAPAPVDDGYYDDGYSDDSGYEGTDG
jgi:hypothetical protein